MPNLYQISKDLGMVTAYAYAVSKGYEGTEEEFAELMASYADIGQAAVDAVAEATRQAEISGEHASDADAAKADAVAARSGAENAKNAATAASNSAVSASNSASASATEASNSASRAAGSADVATQKATAAGRSADSASGSAIIATNKANEASQSAANASASATAANESKEFAKESETNAQISASNAAQSEQSALASKNAAAQSEANAGTSETNAASSASTASAQATIATTKAGEAAQSASDAAASASTATQKAGEAAQSAQAAQDVLDSIPQDYTSLVERVDDLDERKANIDGYYEQMTVGDAEQLVATVGVHDDDPYLFRTAGGFADIGDRATFEYLEGNTVCWNQLVSTVTSNVSRITDNGDGTFTAMSTGATYYFGFTVRCANTQDIHAIPGHKYYTKVVVVSSSINSLRYFGMGNWNSGIPGMTSASGTYEGITNATNNNSTYFNATTDGKSLETDTFTIKQPIIIDLTQMFGTTIADYIYGLEQANAGAGVAFFRSIFPKDYYEYNPGQLMSVQAAMHITRGFNAYDHANGTALLVGGSQYQITGTYTSITFEDGTTITPDTDGYFIPAKTGAISVAGGNSTDTCVHLVWDGERDGEYEPYKANEYTLGEVELRGIPKLENGKIVYDGDKYAPDGTVTRKYGIVDLGTMAWGDNGDKCWVTNSIPGIKPVTDPPYTNRQQGAICAKYPADTQFAISGTAMTDKTWLRTGTTFAVKDTAYENVTAFKAAMSGVYLLYELATPTTEEADPWSNPQAVDDFGTEEFVEFGNRDVQIPVGHSTLYQANLRAKLEMAPNSPDGDGDYVVRQTAGQNEYVPLADATSEAMARKADIDGTYPDLTAGNAEQIVSTVGVDDQAPYNFRTAGGSADIGDRETLNAVVGGSLAWNQMVRDEASPNETEYADIVTVDDAVEDAAGVKVKLEPVQDLHGYDNPWPGGGGINKLDMDSVVAQNAYGFTISKDTDGFFNIVGTYSGTASNPSYAIATKNSVPFDENMKFMVFDKNADAESCISQLRFTDSDGGIAVDSKAVMVNGQSYNMRFRVVECSKSETPTAYIPYSNICPITGWTAARINRTGKNLLNVTESTMESLGYNRYFPLKLKKGTYTMSCQNRLAIGGVGANCQVSIVNSTKNRIKVISPNYGYSNAYESFSFTITDGEANKMAYLVFEPTASGATFSDIESMQNMIELGSTATDYESYQGNTYDIAFPSEAGAVYGGTLTVNADRSGSLVVDRATYTITGTEEFTLQLTDDNYTNALFPINGSKKNQGAITNDTFERNGTSPYTNTGTGVWQGNSNWWYVCLNTPLLSESTITGFKAWLNDNNITCLYYLAEPITYALTAAEITTLLGENHVWSDVGQVSLTYTGTHEFLTLQNGRKYLTRIDGTDAMVAGTGQTLEAVKGTDNVFDLTQMLGSAVADVAYGQGAAWFRKYFPSAKYSYNAGEIVNVQTSGHKMVGFNAWDGIYEDGELDANGNPSASTNRKRSTNFIPVFPSTTYYYNQYISIYYYNSDRQMVGRLSGFNAPATFMTPSNCSFIKFFGQTGYNDFDPSTVCINLSWDGERDGEYEPYEERTYPLDPIELRGIPKLDASNNLYYDGDRYLPDGTVERRYAKVNSADCTVSAYTAPRWLLTLPASAGDHPQCLAADVGNIIANGFKTVAKSSNGANHKYQISYSDTTYVRQFIIVIDPDIVTTVEQARAWVASHPFDLVYELATPTTETAETYQETQIVDDFGTEEFIDSRAIPIPVGHDTVYQPNLRAKLEMVPDSPSDDGDYIVRHVNGQNEYIALPAMPTANGSYRLTATVSNGTPTLAWEAIT